jgi:hypothetical protein
LYASGKLSGCKKLHVHRGLNRPTAAQGIDLRAFYKVKTTGTLCHRDLQTSAKIALMSSALLKKQ